MRDHTDDRGGATLGTPYVVCDLTSLRFQWSGDGDALAALTASGQLLGVVDVPVAASDADAVAGVLDDALSRGRVAGARVAFYNPYTGQVAVGAGARSRVFGDFAPLEVPSGGATAELAAHDGQPRLWVGDRGLDELEPDRQTAADAVDAHLDV